MAAKIFPYPADEDCFERFCGRFLRTLFHSEYFVLYWRRGQVQFGVDVVDLSGAGPLKAGQAKQRDQWKTLSAEEIFDKVKAATSLPHNIHENFILTTAKNGQWGLIHHNQVGQFSAPPWIRFQCLFPVKGFSYRHGPKLTADHILAEYVTAHAIVPYETEAPPYAGIA